VSATPKRALRGFTHVQRHWDQTHGLFAAKILPGEFYVTVEEEVITTVLGSCISACIRDRVFGVGGMNHFMLPLDMEGKGSWAGRAGISDATRFGNHAMERLINEILKHGGSRENLEVKLFGGARVLQNMSDVGMRNIEFIRDYVETEGLQVVAEDLGGAYPRKVLYYPLSGRARMKKLRSLHNQTIVQRENAYLREIKAEPVGGEVELF